MGVTDAYPPDLKADRNKNLLMNVADHRFNFLHRNSLGHTT
jgi:hypothetical protein